MKRPPENNNNDRKRRKCVQNTRSESTSEIYEECELGIIEQVTVQNFMCHENLTLNFEPHMNFIIGQNGSGKSAIATAIQLALGGRSSSTDRFTNMKGFIQSDKNKAKIEVVLRNKGSQAYKPDTYGEKIIVLREIPREGTATYKIKSESGTIYSNHKSELTKILEAMDIMIECPVCILTQAHSKRFLISKEARPERFFDFFYKGTGLEMLEKTYKDMTTLIQDGEAELENKKQVIPDLRKELKKWKKFLDSSNKIFEFKNEKIWAGVIRIEKEIQERVAMHKKTTEELEEHKKNLEGCKKSFAEKKLELDELNKEKSNSLTEMENYRKRLAELNVNYENYSSSFRRNKGTLQRLENEKKKLENDIICLKNCINEQKQKNEKNLEEENRKRQEAVQSLKRSNLELEEKWKTLKEKINTVRNEQNNTEEVVKNLSDEITQHQYELRKIENNLVAAKNALRNKVNAFGEHTESVLTEISNIENRFKWKPVGPLGMLLEVKDRKWTAAIEFAIGKLLNSFYVDNYHDSALLRQILRKYYETPPAIIVSRFESQMFDVKNGKYHGKFPTILDMLRINDHLVANCLIDQCQIEKRILVGDKEAEVSLMNNPPKNCISAYLMNCDQICFDPSRVYSYNKKNTRLKLSFNRAEVIKNFENEKQEKIAKIGEIQRQILIKRNDVKSHPQKIQNLEHEIVAISTNFSRNAMEIKELESFEETKNVNCLEEELESFNRSYEKKEEELTECVRAVSDLELKRVELQKLKDKEINTLKSLEKKYNNLDTEIGNVSKLTESFASGKKSYELELRYKENKCKNDSKELEEFQIKLNIALTNAEATCKRINTDRSYEDICRLITETEKVVQEQSDCDLESLRIKYNEKANNLKRAEDYYKRIERWLNRIGDMLKLREANFNKIRKNTELLISLTFTTICSGNGYIGKLEFDQVKKTLDLEVAPRAGDNAIKNLSSLSGGERSFVTIAFLLALWERTKMPFRILDEYDVFMDSSNRQLCVDLLCKKAVEMSKTQFIFLSPLELTRMPVLDCINILKMAAPKRKGDNDENSPRKKRS